MHLHRNPAVTEIMQADVVVLLDHVAAVGRVIEYPAHLAESLGGDEAIDLDGVEAQRLDVGAEDRVPITEDWFAVVDRF